MKKFIRSLQFIFNPCYWIMLDRYNKELDILMNVLLDEYDFIDIGEYRARLGEYEIWIGNIPYSCMYIVNEDKKIEGARPSRLTIQKGIRKLNNAKRKNNDIKNSKIIKEILDFELTK